MAKINQKITKEEVLLWATIAGVIFFVGFLMVTVEHLLDLLISCHAN